MKIDNSQTPKQSSALIAMSGGIDSTVAAKLTQREGIDCSGAVMILFPGNEKITADAGAAAGHLGIPFHVFDFFDQFNENVIEPFIKDYRQGRTPNPCVVCNKYMKFGIFMEKAQELSKDIVVTGHYA